MLECASISITLDIYSHVKTRLGDTAANAMEEALGHRATVSSMRIAK
jgi:hypothetical protein